MPAAAQTGRPAPGNSPLGSNPSTELPAFAAATIKPAKDGPSQPIGLYTYPGGRVFAGQSSVVMLVCDAFNLQPFQVQGGPPWTEKDRWDVSGVPPDTSPLRQSNPRYINDPPNKEQRAMLQALLIERFGLKSHRASKPGAVLFLQRGNRPLTMKPTVRDTGFPVLAIGGHGDGGMMGSDLTMPFMAARLARFLDHPVLDRTGLAGAFDFQLPPPPNDAPGETEIDFTNGVLESMEQLGLTLKAGKAPIDVLVIDAIHRPTPN